ncbi:zinc finger protein 768-like [Haliotis rufescens]|uniref:zinc finger protein 768-like n=1 Tax=Haliotis rufescens TaxID=6454 RepID=UPI00201F074F|nr:zinc finger protein 768-like [Haliotis rufescens]
MPKSFLVRKKSCVQTRTWEDVATPIFTPGNSDISTPLTTPPPTPEKGKASDCEDDTKEEKAPVVPVRKASKDAEVLSPTRDDTITSNIFQFPPRLNQPHFSTAFSRPQIEHIPSRRGHNDYGALPHFPHLPTLRPPVLWNHVMHAHVHGHAHPASFMHAHSPPPNWLPTPPPFNSSPNTWISPYAGKTPSPLGVLSPAEIPSPSSTVMADEPSSFNSAAIPMHPSSHMGPVDLMTRQGDQSQGLLKAPVPCFPIRERVTPYPKPTGIKVEVINNGFGIKNPLLTNEKPGAIHPDVHAIHSPPAYLMTSEPCHTCSLCGFKTDTPRLLQKHLKTHKEIKRFLCTVCGKGFNDTFDLKRHTRTHTGVRPYKCDICGKAFTQRCSLESHGKKIHGMMFMFAFNERRTKVYVCEECGHSTDDPEEHFLHLRTQHPNNPAILRCHDRRQFKFGGKLHERRKTDSLDAEEIQVT